MLTQSWRSRRNSEFKDRPPKPQAGSGKPPPLQLPLNPPKAGEGPRTLLPRNPKSPSPGLSMDTDGRTGTLPQFPAASLTHLFLANRSNWGPELWYKTFWEMALGVSLTLQSRKAPGEGSKEGHITFHPRHREIAPAGSPHQSLSITLLLLLLIHFSRVRLCVTPETAAHQVPPSLGFSRQEHWSGLPFPSPMQESEK